MKLLKEVKKNRNWQGLGGHSGEDGEDGEHYGGLFAIDFSICYK